MIWGVIFLSGVVTFSTRFLPLSGLMPRQLPRFVQNGLQYVSIAVLTPIVINAVLVDQDSNIVLSDNPKIFAALIAILIALISKSIVLTLLAGLVVIWLFELIF